MNRTFFSVGMAALAAAAAVATVASAGGTRAAAHATGVAWVPCRGVARDRSGRHALRLDPRAARPHQRAARE